MGSRTSGRTVIAVHPHADMYGSDRVFLDSVIALAPDVRVVLSKDGPLVAALTSHGLDHEIKNFPVLRKVDLRTPAGAVLFLLRFLSSIVTLTWWLHTEKPVVLYVSTVAAPEWLIAGRLSRSRVVCHVHENEPSMSRAVSAVLLAPLLLAGVVIANSESTLAWIASSLGQGVLRRSRVVHNGVRSPSAAAAPLAEVVPGAKRLVVVGRLTPRKGQDLAISATALVRQAGFDARLTLVGDGYPGYESLVAGLHALADSEGISDVTEFAGFQDPVPYLTAADLVLVPSRVESFGLVAAEALLLGRPVVAARIGGLPEVIRDGVTGVLVDPDDPQALADAVIALLSDPSAARGLGEAGLADARERFSQETYAARLTEVVLPAA